MFNLRPSGFITAPHSPDMPPKIVSPDFPAIDSWRRSACFPRLLGTDFAEQGFSRSPVHRKVPGSWFYRSTFPHWGTSCHFLQDAVLSFALMKNTHERWWNSYPVRLVQFSTCFDTSANDLWNWGLLAVMAIGNGWSFSLCSSTHHGSCLPWELDHRFVWNAAFHQHREISCYTNSDFPRNNRLQLRGLSRKM